MVNEQFESIARRVRFDGDDWSTDSVGVAELPCPTCFGTAYTHHVDEYPMRAVVGHRDENGETIYRLECGHIVAD